jgi:CheY-like chemotaxis protein
MPVPIILATTTLVAVPRPRLRRKSGEVFTTGQIHTIRRGFLHELIQSAGTTFSVYTDVATVSRVILVHWNATEAEACLLRLRRARHNVRLHAPQGAPGVRLLREHPPDAFVIDLNRLASNGCAVAVLLRQQKATRHIPIVFVGGEPEKVARVRKLLPDAVYTEWGGIRRALQQAIKRPPANPVVPATMDAYSGTPLPKKLGIRGGLVVALLGAPPGFRRTLGELPDDVRIQEQARSRADLIVFFAKSRAEVERRLPGAIRALAEGGRLWMTWPKKTSGVAASLTQADVRQVGLGAGLVDYKICAIDDTWSGLCFARRRSKKATR